jgi:hypothetical protein
LWVPPSDTPLESWSETIIDTPQYSDTTSSN